MTTLYQSRTRLEHFNPRQGLVRGRPKIIEIFWYLVKIIFFVSSIPWPYSFKSNLLALFGATVGYGLVIKPKVNIHLPWKLSLGDHVWIGEDVSILNLEDVVIRSNTCISQRVFLCTGNHDYRDPNFSYRNSPITIGAGVWICAGSIICPGVTVHDDAVISVGSIVISDVPPNAIFSGNPANFRGQRWPIREGGD